MSQNPIFDAVLADSEPDLFLASSIFPRPVTESLEEALARIGHPRFAKGSMIPTPDDSFLYARFKSRVLGVWPDTNAA